MVHRFTMLLLALPSATALAEGHAIGMKLGGLGLGAEYTYTLNERIALRGALYGSEIGFDSEESGIDYEFDMFWDSLSVGVDFHPLKSPFRLSAGLLKNDNGFRAISRPTANVTIGDTSYTPSEVGTLEGSVGYEDSTATFIGLGWDWSRKKRLFGMSLDLGLLDQGAPRVALRGTGTLLADPAFQQDLQAEAAELTDAMDELELAPYLNVGFVFRF
jgi:hypothetical protein